MAAIIIPRPRQVLWSPQDGPQEAFVSCPIEDVFTGGGRGGGKSDGLLGSFMKHSRQFKRYARGILFRQTYDELEEIESRALEIFQPLKAKYKLQRRTFYMPWGGRLKLRYLDRPKDAGRYQGHQYTWMGFDELTKWATPEPIDQLRACLRSAAGVPCVFRATGNPGGPGHSWVKRRYVDPAPLGWEPFFDEENETRRVYIPSTLKDNRILQMNDPNYWKRVRASAAGNEALLRAWAEGDWDIVAGGAIDDVWHRSVHVIEPFDIPESWFIDRSLDWGSAAPYSIGIWAESDGTEAPNGITYPRGTLFRIYEIYGWDGKNANVGTRETAKQVAEKLKKFIFDLPYGSRISKGPADGQIFNKEATGKGRAIIDEFKDVGIDWHKADKSPGSRKAGLETMRNRLVASTELIDTSFSDEPGLFIFSNCKQFIRTVPVLTRDEADPDDVDSNSEDHVYDESRYRLSRKRTPFTVDSFAL